MCAIWLTSIDAWHFDGTNYDFSMGIFSLDSFVFYSELKLRFSFSVIFNLLRSRSEGRLFTLLSLEQWMDFWLDLGKVLHRHRFRLNHCEDKSTPSSLKCPKWHDPTGDWNESIQRNCKNDVQSDNHHHQRRYPLNRRQRFAAGPPEDEMIYFAFHAGLGL